MRGETRMEGGRELRMFRKEDGCARGRVCGGMHLSDWRLFHF